MSIPSFPSSVPPPKATWSGSVYLPQIRDEFESGYVSTRRKFTRAREKMSGFAWEYMTEDEYQALRTFFIEVQGGTFTWVNPLTSATMTLGSAADELKYAHIAGGGRAVEWPLEER